MAKVAFIFPGQGSQKSMMGFDVYQANDNYKSLIDMANSVNPDLIDVMYSEGNEKINDTLYSQLAIFSNQMGLLNLIQNRFDITDVAYAGFSLGEYTALCAGGCFDYEAGVKILDARAKAMSKNNQGCMYAVIGKKQEELVEIMNVINTENKTNIQIANLNTETQQVLAGLESDFELVLEQIQAQIKRVIKLNVSGAFHTSYFNETADEFNEAIKDVTFNDVSNVYSNLTGKTVTTIDHEYLKQHMINGVRFYDEVKQMIADGYDTFVEIGEASVLGAMVKKADRSLNIIHINSIESIDKLEGVL